MKGKGESMRELVRAQERKRGESKGWLEGREDVWTPGGHLTTQREGREGTDWPYRVPLKGLRCTH